MDTMIRLFSLFLILTTINEVKNSLVKLDKAFNQTNSIVLVRK